ncbi:SAM-dependent methyltransferase [Thermoactinospora rubra]|uniref:SAM-dependent methyltransferase n=1 Tax=Thermoactinospora rubra TaxID=1088767 RepID=UPI0030B802E1
MNPHIPSVARMYDYYLGGKDNFAADREAARKIIALVPNAREIARTNRVFLGRAVRHLSASGIRQFLDIGTGLPTQENVHQVAAEGSRVVYVDNDPIVLTHAQALLADNPDTIVAEGDLLRPETILDNPAVRAHLDFSQPVAVLMLAILHFVTSDAEAARAVTAFRDAVVPGSPLVISHVTAGDLSESEVRQGDQIYRATQAGGIVPRTVAQVRSFFEGYDLVEPGVVPLADWRRDPDEIDLPDRGGAGIIGAVGVKRP